LKLLAWNIRAGGGKRIPSIAAVLLEREPDVVVLGEYHANRTGETLRSLLERGGLVHQEPGVADGNLRRVFVASRIPLEREDFPEWPKRQRYRVITARVNGLRLIATYFPSQAPHIARLFKPLIRATTRLRSSAPSLLVGDLNAGLNPADTEGSPFSGSNGFAELLGRGWVDLWRREHPELREYTWYSPGPKNGFRLDHALYLSSALGDNSHCRYDHSVRGKGLSDHSLLEIDLQAIQ
jgi:exonuclease III